MKAAIFIILIFIGISSYAQNLILSTSTEPALALMGQSETQSSLIFQKSSKINGDRSNFNRSANTVDESFKKPELKIMDNSNLKTGRKNSKISSKPELINHSNNSTGNKKDDNQNKN